MVAAVAVVAMVTIVALVAVVQRNGIHFTNHYSLLTILAVVAKVSYSEELHIAICLPQPCAGGSTG